MNATKTDARAQFVEDAAVEYEKEANNLPSTLSKSEIPLPVAADVKAIRDRLGMTQQEFADSFGLSIASVRNWEQGKREPEQTGAILLRLIDKRPKEIAQDIHEIRRG